MDGFYYFKTVTTYTTNSTNPVSETITSEGGASAESEAARAVVPSAALNIEDVLAEAESILANYRAETVDPAAPVQAPDDTPAEPADDPVPEPAPETDPEVEPKP